MLIAGTRRRTWRSRLSSYLRYSDLKTKRRNKSPEEKMSAAERMWETWWLQLCADIPPGQYDQRFSADRMFRFDFSWPDAKVAVEIEGGNWARGRHTRPQGYESDCEKYNLAADLGWAMYRFTPTMLQGDPAACTYQVARAIRRRSRQRRDG
jgi:very-short-patch-repair endonuclease